MREGRGSGVGGGGVISRGGPTRSNRNEVIPSFLSYGLVPDLRGIFPSEEPLGSILLLSILETKR